MQENDDNFRITNNMLDVTSIQCHLSLRVLNWTIQLHSH